MFKGGEDSAAAVVGDDDVEVCPGSRSQGQGGRVMAGRQVTHDGGDALARRGRDLADAPGAQADTDGGRDSPVDPGLAAVRVNGASLQRRDGQVEGAHGIRGAEDEGPARGGGDGSRQVEHGPARTGGEQGIDALTCVAGGVAYAGCPLGLRGVDGPSRGLQVGHHGRGVARDVHPRAVRINDDDTHVGAREERVDGAG